jgi:hypothetical protein
MSRLDWKNIDLSALAKSNVVRGNVVGFVCAGFVAYSLMTCHQVDPNSQQQIAQGVNQAADGAVSIINGSAAIMAVLAPVYSFIHRLIAQPENTAIIVPMKDSTNPPSQKAG